MSKNIKRMSMSFILVFAMLVGVCVPKVQAWQCRGLFSDVPSTHWACEYIEYLATHGIVYGYDQQGGGKYFDPEGSMTRAEFAYVLSRLVLKPLTTGPQVFNDVPNTHWAFQFINSLAINGFFDNEYFKESFQPEKTLSRETIAVIMNTTLQCIMNLSVDEYDPEPIGAKYFMPQGAITRAEICEILFKIMVGKFSQGDMPWVNEEPYDLIDISETTNSVGVISMQEMHMAGILRVFDSIPNPTQIPTNAPTPIPTAEPTSQPISEQITIELNGTRHELAKQMNDFIEGNEHLKALITEAIDPDDDTTNIYFENDDLYFYMIWTLDGATSGKVIGNYTYGKKYECAIEYFDGRTYYDEDYEDYLYYGHTEIDYVKVFVIVQPPKHTFNDIAGHWANNDILRVYDYGIMNGIDHTYFSPEGTLTRAMVATILGQFWEDGDKWIEEEYKNSSSFNDSVKGAWWNPYVEWAKDCDIVNGFEDGTFRPYEPVTRQDFAAMLTRCFWEWEYDTAELNQILDFNDKGQIAPYAKNAVATLVEAGIINGFDDDTFRPSAHTTRAQAAKMMRAYIGIN